MTAEDWEKEVEQIALRRYDELRSLKRQARREAWVNRALWVTFIIMVAAGAWHANRLAPSNRWTPCDACDCPAGSKTEGCSVDHEKRPSQG